MEEMYPLIKNVSLMYFQDGGCSLMLGKCKHDAFEFFPVNYFNPSRSRGVFRANSLKFGDFS